MTIKANKVTNKTVDTVMERLLEFRLRDFVELIMRFTDLKRFYAELEEWVREEIGKNLILLDRAKRHNDMESYEVYLNRILWLVLFRNFAKGVIKR